MVNSAEDQIECYCDHCIKCRTMDQSTPKTENNYYETRIGDAIDEPPPVNPIPDRKGELDETVDIEEYIEMSRDDADDIEADLQRRERNEDE